MKLVKNMIACALLACAALPAAADSGERYIELSREVVACVEGINKELGKINDQKSSDEAYPELKKLADRYMEVARELKTLEPPSSPALINELIPLQAKMKEQFMSFMESRGNLTQSHVMSKQVESLLRNLVKKKQ